MDKNIKCADCVFAKLDKSASGKSWTAYECGNPDSEYYKALLNVTPNGDKHSRISWHGCPEGRVRS